MINLIHGYNDWDLFDKEVQMRYLDVNNKNESQYKLIIVKKLRKN